jgi:protocatechuate 3,4-dioxygenase beta subunit
MHRTTKTPLVIIKGSIMTINRRNLLKNSLISTAVLLALPLKSKAVAGCIAGQKTPAQTEGPFYPVLDQLDTDADLVQVSGTTSGAKGKTIIVEGVVTDQTCTPVPGALVEIWQACESGRYNHPSDTNPAPLDPNFQYWGKAVTDSEGKYRFRTIVPGAYPADANWIRPPHIHFKVSRLGYMELITQMYFAGQGLNEKDLILKRLKKSEQTKVIVDFKEVEKIPHPVGFFNIQIEKL